MLSFNINLTSLAIILWSGMLIIAGSIWVLSSQVRKVADLMEEQSRVPARLEGSVDGGLAANSVRVARRGASIRVRVAGRGSVSGSRRQGQLAPPERGDVLASRRGAAEARDERPRS